MKTHRSIIFFSFISLGLLSCFNLDDYFDGVQPKKLYNEIKFDTVSVAANGVDSKRIVVRISDKASIEKRKVKFKTNSGIFSKSKTDSLVVIAEKVLDDYEAVAELVNLSVATATVTIEILNVELDKHPQVFFHKAFPTALTSVTVDSIAIAGNFKSEVLITAKTVSDTGKPSIGSTVFFKVTEEVPSNDKPIGFFVNGKNSSTTDANGIAQIRFSAGQTNYEGLVTISASTIGVNGVALPPKTTQIYIYKPK